MGVPLNRETDVRPRKRLGRRSVRGGYNGVTCAIKEGTGGLLWKRQLNERVATAPLAVSGEVVYVGTGSNR